MIKKLKWRDIDKFYKIFKEFGDEPFNELWTYDMIQDEFKGYRWGRGVVLGYEDDEDIKGIVTLKYGVQKGQPIEFPSENRIMYLSDIIVGESFRGLGIGTALQNGALDYTLRKTCCDTMYARVSKENSLSEPMFLRAGFKEMRDANGNLITQEVSFPRTKPDTSDTDIRKFLSKQLRDVVPAFLTSYR